MVKPFQKIVPFVFYEWRYIYGLPRQEGLGHFSLKLIYFQSCVKSDKGLKFYAVVSEFGGRQASHHFSPRATINLYDSPFRHDLTGGVQIGLFNVTAKLLCLLSELTERMFL